MVQARQRQSLPRSVRVRSRKAFANAFKLRLRASDGWVTLCAARNTEGQARLGISVGRRFGNAVQRNRIKRLLREAFRRVRHELPADIDWIIIPKVGIEPTVADLMESLHQLTARLASRIPPNTNPPK